MPFLTARFYLHSLDHSPDFPYTFSNQKKRKNSPYSSYSLFFILWFLGKYFAGLRSIELLCEKFGITQNQLYKWLALWKKHKREWLGLLADGETSDTVFLKRLTFTDSYSTFSMEFIRRLRISFLQSHANPVATDPKNAHFHQTVFAPDISIF